MKICKVSIYDEPPCAFEFEKRSHLDDVLQEVRMLLEESGDDITITISVEEMNRDEFEKLPEFQGY
jgi:hypothetical protein